MEKNKMAYEQCYKIDQNNLVQWKNLSKLEFVQFLVQSHFALQESLMAQPAHFPCALFLKKR